MYVIPQHCVTESVAQDQTQYDPLIHPPAHIVHHKLAHFGRPGGHAGPEGLPLHTARHLGPVLGLGLQLLDAGRLRDVVGEPLGLPLDEGAADATQRLHVLAANARPPAHHRGVQQAARGRGDAGCELVLERAGLVEPADGGRGLVVVEGRFVVNTRRVVARPKLFNAVGRARAVPEGRRKA